MKRMLLILVVLVACLSLTAPAVMARGGSFGPKIVTDDVVGQAVSSDFAEDTSDFWIWKGDDGASAGGSSYGYYDSSAFGLVLWGSVSADAFGIGHSETCAYALSLDIFNLSTSMAGATTYSNAYTDANVGCSLGLFTAESYAEVGGIVSQGNHVNEMDNPGAMASAGNSSTAEYFGSNQNCDLGIFGGANSSAYVEGGATTQGSSLAIVDPYGHDRSAYATTQNSGSAYQTGNGWTSVSGNGSANALATNGGSFAGANGSFSYNGSNSGYGSSTVNTNVHTHGNSTTVTSSSHSEAGTGGGLQ